MEILPFDIPMAVRMAGDHLRHHPVHVPMNVALALRLTEDRFNANRQIVSDVLAERNSNYMHHLRDAVRAQQNKIYTRKGLVQRTDGLIKYSTLYYALARDSRNGNVSIYWARDPQHLKTETDQKGFKRFVHDDFRYYWNTLPPNTTEEDIQEEIEKHHHGFREFGINHMAMHGGNMSDTHSPMMPVKQWREKNISEKGYRLETYGFSNDDFAAIATENPRENGGGWYVGIGARFEWLQDGKGFVDFDTIPRHRKFLKALLSNITPLTTHNTKEEALASMFMAINQRSQINWRGLNPIKTEKAFMTNFLTGAWNIAAREIKNPNNHDDVSFDTGVALLAGLAARAFLTASFAGAVVLGLTSNFIMRKAVYGYKSVKKEVEWIFKKAKSVDPNRAPYVLETRENVHVRKFNTKPNTQSTTFMNVQDGNQMDLTYDNESQISPNEKFAAQKLLSQLDDTGFSRISSLIDMNTSSEIFFNGFIRLNHKDPETGNLVTYVKYVKALDVNTNIDIGAEVKKYFKNGAIQKITQEKGKNALRMEAVSFNDMESEISTCMFKDCGSLPDYAARAANQHIKWLFDNATEHKTLTRPTAEVDIQRAHAGTLSEKLNKALVLKRVFGKRRPEIEKPSRELVAFFKDCVMPYASVAVKQFTQARFVPKAV